MVQPICFFLQDIYHSIKKKPLQYFRPTTFWLCSALICFGLYAKYQKRWTTKTAVVGNIYKLDEKKCFAYS